MSGVSASNFTRARGTMARQAIAIIEREPEADSARDDGRMVTALVALGVSWLERGQPSLAVPPLERALRVREGSPLEPGQLGQMRFALARALAQTRGAPARVTALATGARTSYEASPRYAPQRAQIDKWLETRRPGKPARRARK